MRARSLTATSGSVRAASLLSCLLLLGCTGGVTETSGAGATTTSVADDGSTTIDVAGATPGTDGGTDESAMTFDLGLDAGAGHAETVDALVGLLPADALGVAAIDIDALAAAGTADDLAAWLRGDDLDPALAALLASVGRLADAIDVPQAMTTALVARTTDPADGSLLLARLRAETLDEVGEGAPPEPADPAAPFPVHVDAAGNHVALLPGGVLVAGTEPAVASVLEAAGGADGAEGVGASPLAPFLAELDGDAHISFVDGLPALVREVPPDRSLRAAAVMSGSLAVSDGRIGGELVFHTPNAADFVTTFNALNLPSTAPDDAVEEPLRLADPVVDGLGRVVVTIPETPIDPTLDELLASRVLVKKLTVGMEAHDYAEGVGDGGNAAWLDFVVRSEADPEIPPSPGSVYIRWKFRDQAAIEAFERNELPAGFTLAPTRFLEGDDPDGEYFLALNLYNAGGDSIVSGTRAEWDVFVDPPEGADPDAGERPRFMVVDVLAAEVSADPGNLLTPAQPLSHELVDGQVVSSVARFEDGVEVPVFSSTFPVPDPDVAEVARFTREMAIGNDYIYWAHGVSDRVLYNATTFNHDAYLVDTERISVVDESRWSQYLAPAVHDAVYYVNDLEYVASPMANLGSDQLDITPEWLAELTAFRNNGHQIGLMRTAVEQLFRGVGDPFVGVSIPNETPSTYFHFEVTDPDGLAAAIDLPPGHRLAPTTILDGGPAEVYLTLSVFEVEGSLEGMRAEWSVYVDDGDGRPPDLLIVDLLTEDTSFDAVRILNPPSVVEHRLVDGRLSTHLSSATVTFDASFDTAGASEEVLALDWIEAGDTVCRLVGVCDRYYYDAETLDVPVHRPTDVAVSSSTPWDDFVADEPALVVYRDNAQEYAVKRWYHLDVPVAELPFRGLEQRTHVVSGSGELVGRQSDVADSQYTYTGDAVVDGDRITFAIDQRVENALGVGHILTTGSFDLTTGAGTQTVVDCQGPALLCSDIENGATAFYTAQAVDATDPALISWQVDVVLDLGGVFGTADSSSRLLATADRP